MCLTTLALLATAQSPFGQLAFRIPFERNRAFFNRGVATEGSVVSHIEKRPLIACRESDLRSKQLLQAQANGYQSRSFGGSGALRIRAFFSASCSSLRSCAFFKVASSS